MKKIGLIGGMSWESSQIYYKIINEKVREHLGGFHSARCIMESVDFAEIENLQHKNDWASLNQLMVKAAKNLERAEADVIILCTNTMHLTSSEIIKSVNIPFLHIVTETAKKIKLDTIDKVLLLGTKFTMESTFYKDILYNDFKIDVITPESDDITAVHKIIYDELVFGIIKTESRQRYQEIIKKAIEKGVKGVILGCTEIPLLITDADVNIPIYNTTKIHSESAVEFALGIK